MRSFAAALIALLAVLAVCGPSAGLAAASHDSGSSPVGPVSPASDPGAAGVEAPSPEPAVTETDRPVTGPDPGPRAPTGDAGLRVTQSGPNLTRPDPVVVMTINLTANGDARWTVASRFNVSDENDTATFRSFARSVEDGGTNAGIGYTPATFERFARLVERDTNRSDAMRIVDTNWTSEVQNGTGVIALSFTWLNFARTDDSRVILDDVFTANDGNWFRSLSDGQRLVIHSPPNYGVESSRFPTRRIALNDSRTVVRISLDGPRDLQASETPIVYAPIDDPGTSTTNDPQEEGFPWLLGGGFLVLVVALVAGLVWYSRRDGDAPGSGPAEKPTASGGSGTTDGGETTAQETTTEQAPGDDGSPAGNDTGPDPGTTSEATSGAGTAAAVDETADEDDEDDVDVELLSDEERVERLLEQNGGRMKQASIVGETGWSNAKVSQLLSSMEDDDRIEKLRIGRENLITLPDEDVGDIA